MNHSLEKLLDLPHYTEGPVVDEDGTLFFTTMTGGKIYRADQHGNYSVWAQTDCPNGQVISASGEHWLCDSQNASIVRLGRDGLLKGNLIKGTCAGALIGAPNDLVFDSEQNLYFTDSVRDEGRVFFVGNDGKERVVAAGLDYPNGLVLGSGDKCLYVAESYRNRILKMELSEPGVLAGKPEVFADLPVHPTNTITGNLPDGVAMDNRGNLWVAHYGMSAVQLLNSAGHLLHSIDTQMPLTSNLCLLSDTPEIQTLLVTGGYGEPGPGAVLLLTVFQ